MKSYISFVLILAVTFFPSCETAESVHDKVLAMDGVQNVEIYDDRSDIIVKTGLDIDFIDGRHLKLWGVDDRLKGKHLQIEEIGNIKLFSWSYQNYPKSEYDDMVDYYGSIKVKHLGFIMKTDLSSVKRIIDNYYLILAFVNQLPLFPESEAIKYNGRYHQGYDVWNMLKSSYICEEKIGNNGFEKTQMFMMPLE